MAEEFSTREVYRRRLGLVLGGALGLVYGLVSQWINSLFLPGIPFFLPPFGPWGNLFLCVMLGVLLGSFSAWSESAMIGILAGSSLAALFVMTGTLLTGSLAPEGMVAKLLSLFFLFFPIFGAMVPLIWVFRKAIDRLEQYQREGAGWLSRLPWPVTLVLVIGALGAISLYRSDARVMIARTDSLIQAGQSGSDLPVSLKGKGVTRFVGRGAGPYTLQWDRDESNRYLIPRPASSLQTHSVVVARFQNGYLLACLYVNREDIQPRCRDFENQE